MYELLGRYKPTVWKCYRIGRDLCNFTRSLGFRPLKDPVHGPQLWVPWVSETLHAEVKRRTPRNPKGEDWHQDGDLDPGSRMDCGIILWSNLTPTQFRDSTGRVVQPKPYEVVYIRNLACFHRRPPDAPRNRFIFRQRVELCGNEKFQ